jgi:hypothetical protein
MCTIKIKASTKFLYINYVSLHIDVCVCKVFFGRFILLPVSGKNNTASFKFHVK